MNTPGHSILNLAILGRARRPGTVWPILLGSWLPDAALFVFYGWAKLRGMPESVIWREAYYTPAWQDIFAIGNSMPLALMGLALSRWRGWSAGMALFASILLHHAGDLPLHHDDAHRHFWPLTDFRVISPISYWDPAHFGSLGALLEVLLVLLASVLLWRWVRPRLGRGLMVLTNLLYGLYYVSFYLQG